MEDKLYIEKALKGDTRAYGVLVDKYQSLIFVLVRRVCNNSDDAMEILQDVFLKAYQQLHTFRGASSFATWLYRIAFNTAISNVRKTRSGSRNKGTYETEIKHTQDAWEEDPDPEREAQFEKLRQLVDDLPPSERLLIELYYYKELKMEEVAYISGMTVANAKVRIHRIRQKLQTEMTVS